MRMILNRLLCRLQGHTGTVTREKMTYGTEVTTTELLSIHCIDCGRRHR